MSPEERELLTQSIKLAEDNNKMLRIIRRGNSVSIFLNILYWLIVLGVLSSVYFFIQSHVNIVKDIIAKLLLLPTHIGGK